MFNSFESFLKSPFLPAPLHSQSSLPTQHIFNEPVGHMRKRNLTNRWVHPRAVWTQSSRAGMKTGSVKFMSCRSNLAPSLPLPGLPLSFPALLSLFLGVPLLQEVIFFIVSGRRQNLISIFICFAKPQKPCRGVATFCLWDIVLKKQPLVQIMPWVPEETIKSNNWHFLNLSLKCV